MAELPPPAPGQPAGQPGWQPPAGPTPVPPAPPAPAPGDAGSLPPTIPVPSQPAAPYTPAPPTIPMPATASTNQPPFAAGPGSGAGASGSPKKSRVPAIVGALVAVAVGFAAVLWLTRGGDDEEASDTTEQSEDDDTATTPETTVAEAADTTVAVTVPVTTVPLTLPSTAAPATPAPTEPPPTVPVTPVTVPANSTLYTDPAGWSLSVEPTWVFQQTPQFTGWFTNSGTPAFQDNVNVVTEDFSQPFTLDEYVTAALDQISQQAPDATVADQRRVVGEDGVEVEMITWSGTLPGLPTLIFLQAVTVTPERAYIATFTTEPGRMRDLAPLIGPYLATIRPA